MTLITILIKHEKVQFIYIINKQVWGITFNGVKKRLSQKDFNVLLDFKILISYKQSNLKIDYLINQNPLLKWVGSKKNQDIFIGSKFMKGFNGKKIEKYILKKYFNVDYEPKNSKYDLPFELNRISRQNVSIKSKKDFTLNCGSLKNFLSSKNLQLFFFHYKENGLNLEIIKGYRFDDTNSLFLQIKQQFEKSKSSYQTLKKKIKKLKYPFPPKEHSSVLKLCKTISMKGILTVNPKLSKNNRRLHCSLTLKKLTNLLEYELIFVGERI